MIYFDHAATTSMSQPAIQAMLEVMQTTFGNPSSLHSHGREASKILRQTRQELASLLKTSPQKILFTSGGTESNNTILKGYAMANRSKGKHIITTAIEHHAVLETLDYLAQKFGFEVTIIYPENQVFSVQQFEKALRPDTILVSTMFANNETGDLLPIKEIGQLLQNHQAAYHVDAVQAVGKIPIFPEELHIDFLSASAHKFHGPKGVGFLYINDFHFDKLLHGGNQEDKKRAGTENLAAIVGMVAALKDSLTNFQDKQETIDTLGQKFLSLLPKHSYYLNKTQNSLPNVLNIGFPNQANDLLLLRLDLAGISVSTGSACTAGNVEPSHVLAAYYGQDSPKLKESIRISLSNENTLEEVHSLATTITQIIGG